jgi:hypothetical protein
VNKRNEIISHGFVYGITFAAVGLCIIFMPMWWLVLITITYIIFLVLTSMASSHLNEGLMEKLVQCNYGHFYMAAGKFRRTFDKDTTRVMTVIDACYLLMAGLLIVIHYEILRWHVLRKQRAEA